MTRPVLLPCNTPHGMSCLETRLTTTRTYSVPGISCAHCKTAVEAEVSKVAGVEQVSVDITPEAVWLQLGPTDIDVPAAIDEAGLRVAGVS